MFKKAQCSQCHYVFRVKDSPLLIMALSIISVTSTVMSFGAFFHQLEFITAPFCEVGYQGYKVGRFLVNGHSSREGEFRNRRVQHKLLRFSQLSFLISTKKQW